jgi:glutamate-ammonia-ligase adenylyltransferase
MSQDPDRPAWMAGRLSEAITRLTTRIGDADCTALTQAAKAASQWRVFQELLACSDFFGEQAARQHEWLCGALADGTLLEGRDWMAQDWDRALYALLPSTQSEPEALAALRIFRHREMVRILWRDHARLASLEEAFEALSQLADCCIRAALSMATVTLKEKYGTPYGTDSGQPQSLVVLGMGKLGGNELNFSSDIDLIFAYPEGGHTRGGRQELDNQAYFIRLGQMVIRLLDAVTEDGFAFRVDMRLRPYGDSGALVGSYNALEVYYQEQGREWERYAMIKARPISGTPEAQEGLMDMLGPFVYRRYTDFSVIAALREMKNMMRAEVMRLGMDNDLKRGAGGIREIEFIAQSLQLIHGGRIPELRSWSLLSTLSALEQAEVLSTDQARRLATHYRLERRVEHALQAMQDRQTQSLPSEPVPQQQLALLSGFGDWETLQAHLAEAQREVTALFNDLIAEPLATSENEASRDQGVASGSSFASLSQLSLVKLGYQHAKQSWAAVADFLDSTWVAALQPEGRRRLETFLPLLCEMAAATREPDAALTRSLPFVRAVCRRSAYLVLLQENPRALQHLLTLVASSIWLSERLAARPELVDELLHESTLYSAPSREELHALVRQQLLRIPEEDLEAQMSALSRIKDGVILRVAASELTGTLPIMKVSDNLTFLAEVMIEQALAVARAELVQRYGEPQSDNAGFAVIAYGKLGGLELSYGSDLDLVFVFDGASGETAGPKVIDNTRFYMRLAQRVVHVLSAQTYAGRLYEVDLRLRPEGDAGLVATTLPALRRYQLQSAWVWEHQALVRTRVVAGDAALKKALESLRMEVLALPREQSELASAVCDMRDKMRVEHTTSSKGRNHFDLKRDPGGIVDIEFVVQYLVLAHAGEHAELTIWSDVIRLLEALEQTGLIAANEAKMLSQAYLDYRSATHSLGLQGRAAETDAAEFEAQRQQVRQITEALLPGLQAG